MYKVQLMNVASKREKLYKYDIYLEQMLYVYFVKLESYINDMMWCCSESDSDSDVIADDSEASFSDDNPDYINYQVSFILLKMVITSLILGYFGHFKGVAL